MNNTGKITREQHQWSFIPHSANKSGGNWWRLLRLTLTEYLNNESNTICYSVVLGFSRFVYTNHTVQTPSPGLLFILNRATFFLFSILPSLGVFIYKSCIYAVDSPTALSFSWPEKEKELTSHQETFHKWLAVGVLPAANQAWSFQPLSCPSDTPLIKPVTVQPNRGVKGVHITT